MHGELLHILHFIQIPNLTFVTTLKILEFRVSSKAHTFNSKLILRTFLCMSYREKFDHRKHSSIIVYSRFSIPQFPRSPGPHMFPIPPNNSINSFAQQLVSKIVPFGDNTAIVRSVIVTRTIKSEMERHST